MMLKRADEFQNVFERLDVKTSIVSSFTENQGKEDGVRVDGIGKGWLGGFSIRRLDKVRFFV